MRPGRLKLILKKTKNPKFTPISQTMRGGLMVSVLDSGSTGPGSSPGHDSLLS